MSWGTDVKESYQTALDIYAKDRLDLVLDVSAALSSSQTRVASINATTTADGFAVIHLSISFPTRSISRRSCADCTRSAE